MHPLLPIVLLLFGLIGMFTAVRSFLQERKQLSWPSVEGVIRDGRLARRSRGLIVRVRYAYELNGVHYKGFEESTWTDKSASLRRYKKKQGIATSYKPGDTITVFYDPENPRHSTIAPGHAADTPFIFLVGLAMTVAGGWLLLL